MTFPRKPRCTGITRKGDACTFSARFGPLCTNCASAARDPAALAYQAEKLARKAGTSSPDFVKYVDDPVAFAVDCLGITPWSRQADFLRAVAAHDRVALKAGQKVSKSNSLAILMLWFVKTRPGARGFFTNSSERQVATVNYREQRRLIKGARVDLGIKHVHDTPGRGVTFNDGGEILGFATNEEDRWGGLSGDDLLFIVDEASGVPSSLFEAIEGNCAGDNAKLVICGNPLRPADYFYDCFNSKAPSWHCLTISSLESPNVVEGTEVIRGLASRGYVARVEENYGRGSPFWMGRVEGNFPSRSEHNVNALADVLAAVQRGLTAAVDLSLQLVCGLDAARFGDDKSCAVFVRGSAVIGIHTWQKTDGPTLAGFVAEAAQQYRQGNERVLVNVDVIGIGASPYDAMAAYDWIDAVAVNVAESPTIDDHYSRLRDQLWFEGAKWMKTGAIPNDPKLIGELTSPVYSFDIKGDRKVEAKADLKKRLKRSPDRADALLLAVAMTAKPQRAIDLFMQLQETEPLFWGCDGDDW